MYISKLLLHDSVRPLSATKSLRLPFPVRAAAAIIYFFLDLT